VEEASLARLLRQRGVVHEEHGAGHAGLDRQTIETLARNLDAPTVDRQIQARRPKGARQFTDDVERRRGTPAIRHELQPVSEARHLRAELAFERWLAKRLQRPRSGSPFGELSRPAETVATEIHALTSLARMMR
jgi:hypothetical protein